MQGNLKIALALGGGAARGLAHVGVLRVLAENDIPVHMIVGTSIGAMVGGLYACTGDIDLTERRLTSYLDSPAFRRNRFEFLKELRSERKGLFGRVSRMVRRGIFVGYSVSRISFISAQQFEHSINNLLDDEDIEETRIPFAAVACDLRLGEEVVLRNGSLRKAVSASSAIPGVLPPVEWGDRLLVDGGWVSKVPILPAFKMGADAVIAVDISTEMRDTKRLTRGYDIIFRSRAITDSILKRLQCRMSDVLIRPNVGAIHWADFGRAHDCIALGEEATREHLEEIRALVAAGHSPDAELSLRGRRLARYYMGDRLAKAPSE